MDEPRLFGWWAHAAANSEKLRERYGEYIKVEFGPGRQPKPLGHASIGLNKSADPGCDIYADISMFIPLDDESVDEISSKQFLEHVPRECLISHMNECWRILKPGGFMTICVPMYNGPHAWGDPTHRQAFSERTFDYFCVRADGTPFVDQFSDYGIKCAFMMEKKEVRNMLDITVVLRKPK